MIAEWLRLIVAKYNKLFFFSSLHSVFLLILTFWWMQLHWQFGDELFVARINQIAKYLVFENENPVISANKKNTLLINCSYDKMLVPYSDEYGDGNRAVTDRMLLYQFFKNLNESKQPPRLVLVDHFFDYPSENDSLLFEELKKIPNAVFSSYRDNSGLLSEPVPGLNYALAQYESTGMFLKYSILSPNYRYVPEAIYEIMTGDTIKKKFGLIRSHKGWWMNTFTVDIAVRRSQIGEEGGMVLWNLGDAIRLIPAEELQKTIENKIIIIGDFYERDIHETLLGDQPGPLILLNAYISLLLGAPLIRFIDILLLFLLYFLTSIYILRVKTVRKSTLTKNIKRWRPGRFLLKYFSYLFIFSCFTVAFYIITLKHFQLVLFAFYFNLFEYLVIRYRRRKNSLRTKQDQEPQNIPVTP